MGVENFARFYQEAGGDMEQVKQKIDEYKAANIENKAKLDSEDAKNDLTQLDDADVSDKSFKAMMDTKKAGDDIKKMNKQKLQDKPVNVIVHDTLARDALTRIDRVSLRTKSTTITADDQASSVLNNIKYRLDRIKSKTITVTAVGQRIGSLLGSATGSVANTPYIPRHADGYVAAGPTLTNNGWVGEDGAEAILNWGTGGAVIPLTNHRYMDPLAHEIARSLAPLVEGSGRGTTNVYNVGGVTYDDGSAAASAVSALVDAVMIERRR